MDVKTETLQGLTETSCWELKAKQIFQRSQNAGDIEILTQPEWKGLDEHPRHSHEGLKAYALEVRKIP